MVSCEVCGLNLPFECACKEEMDVKVKRFLEKSMREIRLIKRIWFEGYMPEIRLFLYSDSEVREIPLEIKQEKRISAEGIEIGFQLYFDIPSEFRGKEVYVISELYDEEGVLYRKFIQLSSLISDGDKGAFQWCIGASTGD